MVSRTMAEILSPNPNLLLTFSPNDMDEDE